MSKEIFKEALATWTIIVHGEEDPAGSGHVNYITGSINDAKKAANDSIGTYYNYENKGTYLKNVITGDEPDDIIIAKGKISARKMQQLLQNDWHNVNTSSKKEILLPQNESKKNKIMTKQEVISKLLKQLKDKGLLNESAIKTYLAEQRHLKRKKRVLNAPISSKTPVVKKK